MRVFKKEHLWVIEEHQYRKAIDPLAGWSRPQQVNAVIGIARGGIRPAEDIANCLQIQFYQINACFNRSDEIYSDTRKKVEVDLNNLPKQLSTDARVLLVDDICGSGATMTAVCRRLTEEGYAAIHTAAICLNMGSCFRPQAYVWEVNEWVIFPWEKRPSGSTHIKPLLHRGRSSDAL